jgi:hypothetical protein
MFVMPQIRVGRDEFILQDITGLRGYIYVHFITLLYLHYLCLIF